LAKYFVKEDHQFFHIVSLWMDGSPLWLPREKFLQKKPLFLVVGSAQGKEASNQRKCQKKTKNIHT
jgi:hypothetical protein